MRIDPISLARELIDIPSPTGEEKAVSEHLERLLTSQGFSCRRQEVEADRFNLWASAGRKPRVVLCTHTDTVPPFFASSEDGNRIYGRGACDTKGILAAMLAAAFELKAEGTEDFAFLLVVDEETNSIGAKLANDYFAGEGSEYVVVGEPTESRFVRASKGALTATVAFRGIAAHSAYPEKGDSAIRKLVAAAAEIDAADWGTDEDLGKATVNIGTVRGGLKPNIVPPEAEMQMIFRTVSDPDSVLQQLERIISRHDGSIVRSHGNPPVRMVVPEGAHSVVVAFNTDVPHLSRLGRPLLFGPGSILDAHTERECIGKGEIISAVATYRELVRDLLAGKVNGW